MQKHEFVEHEKLNNNYPNVHLRAQVSADGGRITIYFPMQFIGSLVAFIPDPHGRHRIFFDPLYNGKDVVGYVNAQGVQEGKVEINPASIGMVKCIPGKVNFWWAKQRDNDLLIGHLLSDLREAPPIKKQPHALTVSTPAALNLHEMPQPEIPMFSRPALTDPVIPKGWKLVPLVPTDDMMKAAKRHLENYGASLGVHDFILWAAIQQAIETSPPPPPQFH